MSINYKQIKVNIDPSEVKELIIKFNELFPEYQAVVSKHWKTNYKTLISLLNDFFGYDGELTYEAINDFMTEFHKEYIKALNEDDKPEEEPNDEPFYEEHRPTYEDDDINEDDKLYAIIGKAEQIKQQAMKKLKEKQHRIKIAF